MLAQGGPTENDGGTDEEGASHKSDLRSEAIQAAGRFAGSSHLMVTKTLILWPKDGSDKFALSILLTCPLLRH